MCYCASWRDIQVLHFGHDLVAKIGAEEAERVEIDSAQGRAEEVQPADTVAAAEFGQGFAREVGQQKVEGVGHPASPSNVYVILADKSVTGKQDCPLDPRLANKQPIEGIAMVARQFAQCQDVFQPNGQYA